LAPWHCFHSLISSIGLKRFDGSSDLALSRYFFILLCPGFTEAEPTFLIATFQQSGGQSTVSDDPADDSRNKCVISGFPLTVAFDKHPSKEKKQS